MLSNAVPSNQSLCQTCAIPLPLPSPKKRRQVSKKSTLHSHYNSKIYAFARTAWKALPLLIKSETTRATAAAVYAGMNTLRRL